MQLERAIVTGGSGFIGSHLVDALVERGVDVTVVDKAEPKAGVRNAKASYVIRDIREDGLAEVFSNVRPTVVFHLAAHIDDRESVTNPVMNADNNVMGALRVFEAARLAGAKKILFASTSAVYGGAEKIPFTEKTAPRPMTPYAVSKLTGEHYLSFYYSRYGIPYTALRIGNVYGPRQDGSKESGAVAIFTKKLMSGEEVFINDDGKTIRDYIYVGDVVSLFIAAAESDVVDVYNCSTNVGTATGDLFALVAGVTRSSVNPTMRPEVKDAAKVVRMKNAKARKELGWKPVMRLAKGVKQTVKWYAAQVKTSV